MPPHSIGNTLSKHGKVPKDERKFEIWISEEIKKFKAITILTVLHECVHVETWDRVTQKSCHGRLFNKRMKQLANKGAFNGLW